MFPSSSEFLSPLSVHIIQGVEKDSVYIMNVQRDATMSSQYFIFLQDHSTCFGCPSHPSSGVQVTVLTATGISQISR
jgi:hypothetical protein